MVPSSEGPPTADAVCYLIKDDSGQYNYYDTRRFITLEEYRDLKLANLLETNEEDLS
jgi:hypothetical protein